MVIYCDYCKINTLQNSKAFFKTGNEVYIELDACPVCGNILYIADSLETIP